MDWEWGFGFLGAALSLAFMLVLGLIIVAILVWIVSGGSRRSEPTAGLRVLDELYANGEITRDEYLERKKVLSQS